MKSKYQEYDFEKSRSRIDDILSTEDKSFEEVDSIPSRDKLTFTNGFYINKTSALFVDIVDSSKLPSKYRRPILARIYRSFLSEAVAVINGNDNCAEVNINGDCVWGVFDAQYQYQINSVFDTAAKVSSIIDTLNCMYKRKGIDPISVGIGLAYGRALMIKAGYSGSGLNEVVWMGDVVNEASNLCSYGNQSWNDKEMMVSSVFRNNLDDHNKGLLERNSTRGCYHGNVINKAMDDWLKENSCE